MLLGPVGPAVFFAVVPLRFGPAMARCSTGLFVSSHLFLSRRGRNG